MKTHSFTINSKEREIPSFDGLEFGTEKPKSKETKYVRRIYFMGTFFQNG